jgi:hypothetical protein
MKPPSKSIYTKILFKKYLIPLSPGYEAPLNQYILKFYLSIHLIPYQWSMNPPKSIYPTILFINIFNPSISGARGPLNQYTLQLYLSIYLIPLSVGHEAP